MCKIGLSYIDLIQESLDREKIPLRVVTHAQVKNQTMIEDKKTKNKKEVKKTSSKSN